MKIIRLSLENFQGLRKTEFLFSGRNADIYGDNAVGKTTVFNAFTWLLFGNSSTGAKDYNPKTKTEDGDAHKLEHSVECEMEIDGEIITFKRLFKEVWKKTRGQSESNLSGHTTDFFINGVPKKEKEYNRYWEDIFKNDELPKLLSMPFYFPETLHWDKRRQILLDICGVISDHEIMQTDDELKILAGLLGSNTVDEFKKITKSSLTKINSEIQSIPARIDEAQKAIPNWSDYSHSHVGIDDALATVRENITNSENERAALLSNDESASQIRKTIASLEWGLAEDRRRYSERQQTVSETAFNAIKGIRSNVIEAERQHSEANTNLEKARATVAEIEKKRSEFFATHKKMQEDYDAVQVEVFDESSTICVTCNRELEPDSVAEIRKRYNEIKSNRLTELKNRIDSLVEKAKNEASKEMLAEAGQAAENAEKALTNAKALYDRLAFELQEAERKQKESALPPFDEAPEYKRIIEKIASAKSEESQSAPDTSDIDGKITEYRKEETDLNSVKAALETEKTQKTRIGELEKQEQELGKSYEEAQRYLYLCEKFTRIKSELLNDKINERFQTVSFQLFKKNITNDGIEDSCDVLIPSEDGSRVPFPLANNAARINAGLEIIGVLGEHYGVELPVFVDNAESVTRLIEMSSQIIRLIVSETDKKLRLELL